MEASGKISSLARGLIPPLGIRRHKGEAGRVAVIGGSQEYTGAPYFAAISALKAGADLSHVFCVEAAGPVIKSYSPDIIVHPILDHVNAVQEISAWLPRFHSIVIGPGLGRQELTFTIVKELLVKIKERDIPVVFDADGLMLICHNPKLIEGYRRATLTPNAVEFSNLYTAVFKDSCSKDGRKMVEETKRLSGALGNVTVVRKGHCDVISNGVQTTVCEVAGSLRRVGGQGDILSGTMGLFMFWAHHASRQPDASEGLQSMGPGIVGAWASCALTRDCSRRAFNKNGRSMVTSDMIEHIGPSMDAMFL